MGNSTRNEPGIYRPRLSIDGNFTMIPNDWIRKSGLSPAANLLLVYLIGHESGYRIEFDQIKRETRMGDKLLRASLKELQEAGWLLLERTRQPDGRLGAYAYTITEAELPEDSTLPQATMPPATLPQATMPPATLPQATVAKGEDYKRENNLKDKDLRIESSKNTERDFADFWDVYPRKLDKGKAERAFRTALKKATADQIIAGAIRYRDDPNRKPDFTKYPATWLNAEAWENETATAGIEKWLSE